MVSAAKVKLIQLEIVLMVMPHYCIRDLQKHTGGKAAFGKPHLGTDHFPAPPTRLRTVGWLALIYGLCPLAFSLERLSS